MKIILENIYKYYGETEILNDVDLNIDSSEFVCIVGESRSGKTTLLKIVAGLIEPSKGVVHTDDQSAMVFQNSALLPWLTVKQNVSFPFMVEGLNAPKQQIEQLLSELGIKTFENKYPKELSGGQKQRVGIARAMAVKRKILLLDEPFSALDIKIAEELYSLLLGLWRTNKLTVLMVSHSIEEAVLLADRVVIMDKGKIRREITIDLKRPRQKDDPIFRKYVEHIQAIVEN
ncbi:MAG: ABC transporter ATP-binding protein [Patescibacteria group bacterium]